MNIIIFLVITLIFYILLMPNFLIIIPPEDLEWFNYKSYIVKNRIKYLTIISHSIIFLLLMYLFIKFGMPKLIKKDIKIKNFNTNNYIKNIELI